MRRHFQSLALVVWLAGCGQDDGNIHSSPPLPDSGTGADAGAPPAGGDVTPDVMPDSGAPGAIDLSMTPLMVGGAARVTAAALNLRTGPGTMNPVIASMKCGDAVQIAGGPSGYWWNVNWQAQTGWASGNYLIADGAYDPAVCMLAAPADGGVVPGGDGGAPPMTIDQMAILARAKLGVGYSYYWGHGAWRSDGAQPGACMGSCPNCSHNGTYGADCSGFVAKCWQVPTPSPLTTDLHPYSSYNFYHDTTHWAPLPRTQIRPADALVYNANGAGHIMLFESGADPWGNIWTYEARGCATGVVHNLRVAPAEFITIRREGI